MELINNNQVPEGYKKTEVGVIPEDWETCKLGEAVDFLDEKRKPIKESERAKMRGIYPYYGASGIVDYVNNYLFDEELILLGEDGENILSRNTRLAFRVSGKVWVNNHAHVLKPKIGFDINFLTEYLESLDYSLYNSGTAQPKLNQQICQNIVVVQPLIKEQKAIAQTLSDVDALTASLDKLIAKKRHIKTGTMQQLLTGKTRLPGFGEGKGYKKSAIGVIPEDWEVDDLGKFITEFRGGAPLKPSDFTNGGVKVLPKGAVVRGGFLKINDKDLQFCSKQYANHYGKNKINNTYIVVVLRDLVPSGPSIGLIVKIKKPEIYILAQGVYGFKTQGIIDEYLIQYSNSFPYRKLMNEIMVGSTQVHITNTAFKAIKLPFPPLPQQKAIAQVLSDIDTEITALEKRRAKTQAIKQGMMQELLTGRTRLKIEHPDDPITKNSNG